MTTECLTAPNVLQSPLPANTTVPSVTRELPGACFPVAQLRCTPSSSVPCVSATALGAARGPPSPSPTGSPLGAPLCGCPCIPPPALPDLVIPYLRTFGTRAGATHALWCFAVRCLLFVLVGGCSQCVAVRFWCCWGWEQWRGRKEEAGRN